MQPGVDLHGVIAVCFCHEQCTGTTKRNKLLFALNAAGTGWMVTGRTCATRLEAPAEALAPFALAARVEGFACRIAVAASNLHPHSRHGLLGHIRWLLLLAGGR